jgi:hypothetical protein
MSFSIFSGKREQQNPKMQGSRFDAKMGIVILCLDLSFHLPRLTLVFLFG